MKKLISYIIFQITIIFFMPINSLASIELTLQNICTVPTLTYTIEQVLFNDIDNDQTPEVLVSDGEQLILYSITGDSILLSTPLEQNYINHTILFDDVNRDLIPDIIVGYYFEYDTHLSDTVCKLDFFDGSLMYQQLESYFYEIERKSSLSLSSPFRFVSLKALDINNDGYNELFFSYDKHRTYDINQNSFLATTGSNYLYESLPQSIIWQDGKLFHNFNYLTTMNNNAIYITTIFDNFTSKDITQNSYHSSSTMSVEVINNEGDILTTIYEPYDGLFCTGDSTSFINEFQFLCSGNMVTSDADNEILVKYEWQQNCYSPPDNSYISSGSELKLYRLVSSDSTELIWTVDNVDNYSDFFYSTKYPGYFFTIKDGVIYQFNGVYGSPYQTSVQLLADSIIWINSFNEDFGNIVTINNQTISVYKIDMTLTVEDELENNIIPSAFVLSTPYPNPFNPSTIIEYSIPHRSQVTISIYNIAGQKVTTVINEIKPAGAHQIIWDGKNDSSEPVSSGIYLIKATLDNEIRTAKAVLLK